MGDTHIHSHFKRKTVDKYGKMMLQSIGVGGFSINFLDKPSLFMIFVKQ